MRSLTPRIHELALGIVNAWLIQEDEGVCLIDTGGPGRAEEILAAVRNLGLRPEDVRHIVLTHHHADHAGSIAALRGETPAKVYAHPRDAALIRRGVAVRPELKPSPGIVGALVARLGAGALPQTYQPGIVDGEVADGQVLPIAGGLRVIHAPGHSAGHIALLSEREGVLFAADACGNMFGLGPSLMHEDTEQAMRSLARLSDLDFSIACFGHGRALTREARRKFRGRWKTKDR